MHPTRLWTTRALALFLLAGLADAQIPLYELDGATALDWSGYAVADVGDVDFDGFPDVAVGAPFDDYLLLTNNGTVRVYSGRTGAVIRTWRGENAGDQFGWAVDGVGDVNFDGFADVIAGAPRHNGFDVDSGGVYVISGADGSWLAKFGGTQANAQAGSSVAGLGDVDFDGWPDYAFGSPWQDWGFIIITDVDMGRVDVMSGKNHTTLWALAGDEAGDLFGYSLDGTGDVDGDGGGDFVVGAPLADQFVADNGVGYVFSGATAAVIYERFGAWTGGQMGTAVAGVGDLDGDGLGEVAFGEPYSDGGGTNAGRVLVSSSIWPHNQVLGIAGVSGSEKGFAVAGAGDLNGDGTPDLLIGAPRYDFFGSADLGLVQAHSGVDGSVLYSWLGLGVGDWFGSSVSSAGDLNGDGRPDVIAGGYRHDQGGQDAGHARVFLYDAPLPSNYCVGKTNSLGCTPKMKWSGAPSVAVGDNFHVEASSVYNYKTGLLIWAFGAATIPFGGGTLCLQPPIKRTSIQLSGGLIGSNNCTGRFDFHFSQTYMASVGVGAGDSLYAQYWSRDSGFSAPNDISLTDALSFDVVP